MIPMRSTAVLALALWSLTATGCFGWKRKARVFTPPPPAQTRPAPQPPMPDPPGVEVAPPSVAIPQSPVPEPKPAPHTRVPRPKPAVPATPPPQTAPAPPAPQFGEITSQDQRAGYLRNYEQSAQAARRALGSIAGRRLTREQADNVTRSRSFLRQAEDLRLTDPAAAANLARRAEQLAASVLASLR